MSSRPHTTVILITGTDVTRADYAARPATVVPCARKSLEGNRDLAAGVELALAEAGPVGRRVIVLSTSFPAHILNFPSATVHTMRHDELREAMKYEVETLVGIEIENLMLAYRPAHSQLDGEARFWVNAVRRSDYQDISRRLMREGARQIYFAHPAGVFPFRDAAPTRCEVWGTAVYEFDANSHRIHQIARLPSEDLPPRDDVFWIWGEGNATQANSIPAVNLTDEASLQQAMLGAAKDFGRLDQFRAPLIHPERKPAGLNLRPVVTALLALFAAGGCLLHWNWIRQNSEWLAQSTADLALPAADKRRFDAEQIKLLEQQKQLEADALSTSMELKRVQFFFDYQRDRYPKLLKMLIDLRSPEMVIQKLIPDKTGLIVGGISLNGEAAQALANRLRPQTSPLGWKVAGVRQEGEQKMTSGGPWNFEVSLQDVGPFDQVPLVVEQAVTTIDQ